MEVYRSLARSTRSLKFKPWSQLTKNLWDAFRDITRTSRQRTQEISVTKPPDLDGLGNPADRWWYTRSEVFNNKTWSVTEGQAIRTLRTEYGDEVVRGVLAEAAEWGRTEASELSVYAESMQEEVGAS